MTLKERMAEVERIRIAHMLRYHPADLGAEPRTCQWCGGTYTREPGISYAQWAKSKFCTRACTLAAVARPALRTARLAARAAAVIEDVEWLLRTDPDPASIAARAGYSNHAHLIEALHRWGRDDLASQLTHRSAA